MAVIEPGLGEILLLLAVLALVFGPTAARRAGRRFGRAVTGGVPGGPHSDFADAPRATGMAHSALDACFRTLDLPPTATLEQVRQAYKELAKVWHPDRFGNDAKLIARANEKMCEINAAYDALVKALRK